MNELVAAPVFVSPQRLPSSALAKPVTHEHVALAYYTEGTAIFEQRTRWRVSAGDVVLVPAGEPHRVVEARGCTYWGAGLCPVCFIADGAEALLEPFERVRRGGAAVVTIPESRRAFFESLFVELARELESPGPGTLAVQKSLVTLMVAEVTRAAGDVAPDADDLVSEALRFIERRCLEPISARDVAAALHRSPAHLSTRVRLATGRSVQAWIVAGRMSEARRRLAHTDERIDVIAERVSYADATHFIRVFRREHGMTPSAWRARFSRGRS